MEIWIQNKFKRKIKSKGNWFINRIEREKECGGEYFEKLEMLYWKLFLRSKVIKGLNWKETKLLEKKYKYQKLKGNFVIFKSWGWTIEITLESSS